MCRIDGGCPQQARRAGFREQAGRMPLFETVRYFGPICVQDARTITVFVQNTGQNPLTAYLEVGPDGSAFMEDPQRLEVQPGEMGAVTPFLFSRYFRVAAWSASRGSANIFVQMQNE